MNNPSVKSINPRQSAIQMESAEIALDGLFKEIASATHFPKLIQHYTGHAMTGFFLFGLIVLGYLNQGDQSTHRLRADA